LETRTRNLYFESMVRQDFPQHLGEITFIVYDENAGRTGCSLGPTAYAALASEGHDVVVRDASVSAWGPMGRKLPRIAPVNHGGDGDPHDARDLMRGVVPRRVGRSRFCGASALRHATTCGLNNASPDQVPARPEPG